MTVTLRLMRTAPSHRHRAAAVPRQRRRWPTATAATMVALLLLTLLLCRHSRHRGLQSMRIGAATRTLFVPSEPLRLLLGDSRRSRGSFLRLPLLHLHPLLLITPLLLLCPLPWEVSSNCFALPSPSRLLLLEPPLRLPPRLRKGPKPASLPTLLPRRLMQMKMEAMTKQLRLLYTPWHRRERSLQQQ